jgi:hypothetical protein
MLVSLRQALSDNSTAFWLSFKKYFFLSFPILAKLSYTDWAALSQEFATQLKAFGINSQVFELSTSDFYSEFFSEQFEVSPFFTPFTDTIDAWRIASIIPQPPFNLSKPTWCIYMMG